MTRKQFKKATGEWPEDVLGEDWENILDEWAEPKNTPKDAGRSE